MAATPRGVWFNRVHTFEEGEGDGARTVHFPRSCLHCEEPACVTVCPTGASYKRAEDGIVLVNADICIGCKLCSWACPYGAREFDDDDGVMKKCTLCVDRIYNENLRRRIALPACVAACPTSARHFGDLGDPNSAVSQLVAERGGFDLMPELGYQPVNKYLPPRAAHGGAGRVARSRIAEPAARAAAATGCCAGSTGCCRADSAAAVKGERPMHPALVDHLLYDLPAPGSGCCLLLGLAAPLGLVPPNAGFGVCLAGGGGCSWRRRAGLLRLASRPARAGVAGVLAMALVMAVARGRARRC